MAWARSNKCRLTDMQQLGSVKKLIIVATAAAAEADAEAAVDAVG